MRRIGRSIAITIATVTVLLPRVNLKMKLENNLLLFYGPSFLMVLFSYLEKNIPIAQLAAHLRLARTATGSPAGTGMEGDSPHQAARRASTQRFDRKWLRNRPSHTDPHNPGRDTPPWPVALPQSHPKHGRPAVVASSKKHFIATAGFLCFFLVYTI